MSRESKGISDQASLANAVLIAAYTLVDGAGVRLAGSAASYSVWLFFFDGFPYVLIIAWLRRGELLPYARRNWRRGLIGGALSQAAGGDGIDDFSWGSLAIAFLGACLLLLGLQAIGGRRVTGRR